MSKHTDLGFLDLNDHFEIVDPLTLELPAEEPQPAGKTQPIVASMERHGLLECPLVAGKKVIDGARRVRAAIALGRQFILIRQVGIIVDPAIVLAHSYLVRRPVTLLREAEQLAGLKLEYELLHPETAKGGNQKAKKAKKEQNDILAFCSYVAELTDRDPRTIQRLVRLATLDTDVKLAIHQDVEFANHADKMDSLFGCGKGEAKSVTQLELFHKYQANPKWEFLDCVNDIVKEQKLNGKEKELAAFPLAGDSYQILPGDFRDRMKEIADASIDAVITDPVYMPSHFDLLPVFVKETARVLKPNGFAVVMFGNMYLNVAVRELEKRLHYRGIIADFFGGKGQTLFGVGISNKWKAILIYGKTTKKLPTFGGDIIQRPIDPLTGKPQKSGKEKQWFEWQQPLFVFEELVKRVTKPGDTILDPFLGSGTTMIAALKHGRKCIGIELEPERIRYTKYRLLYELDIAADVTEKKAA
jgi:site-specific DNA-methyltransferase (adenine-specific)